MYVVGALPGAAFMAWLNTRWYGGAAASGYGTAAELFSLARIPGNIVRYGGWLIETSPLALLGVAALARADRPDLAAAVAGGAPRCSSD